MSVTCYWWDFLTAGIHCSRTGFFHVFYLLATRDKNSSRMTLRTMASVNTIAASHPYLPCPLPPTVPSTGKNVSQLCLSSLLYASAPVTVAPRRLRVKVADIVDSCMWRLFLLIFSVFFYVGAIAVMAEISPIGIINDKIF